METDGLQPALHHIRIFHYFLIFCLPRYPPQSWFVYLVLSISTIVDDFQVVGFLLDLCITVDYALLFSPFIGLFLPLKAFVIDPLVSLESFSSILMGSPQYKGCLMSDFCLVFSTLAATSHLMFGDAVPNSTHKCWTGVGLKHPVTSILVTFRPITNF